MHTVHTAHTYIHAYINTYIHSYTHSYIHTCTSHWYHHEPYHMNSFLSTRTCFLIWQRPSLDLHSFGGTLRTARRGRCKGTGEPFEIGQLRVGFEARRWIQRCVGRLMFFNYNLESWKDIEKYSQQKCQFQIWIVF